ncbi:MAG TPA: alkaline phosphatase family protein [Acidimicrobiales bacterium]|nr:alkaline phosphatase family protein [Acidimicrobiales bacterium]
MRTRLPLIPSALAAAALAVAMVVAAPGAANAGGGAAGLRRIDHFVVLMQENRSADTYLGHLSAFDPTSGFQPEPATGNPDPTDPTRTIRPFHKDRLCEVADLDHSWNGTHREWDGGRMDGFTAANAVTADPTGSRSMGYYDQRDLPYYYALYNTFATSDRQFASVLSQTFPNRFYLLAGTSFGHIRNDFPAGAGDFDVPTIFQRLDGAGVSWRIYFSQIAFGLEFKYVRDHAAGHVFPISQYYADAATGQLPSVSFVDPVFVGPADAETDEHPPSNVQVGEKFSADVIDALMHSPDWPTSALIHTYDEHGGFYDSVAPPRAPAPDDIAPMLQPGDAPGGFDRLGVRVPIAVVSPWSRPHFVSHVARDHTAVLKLIETRYGLAPLTRRDAWVPNMLEFFDFSHGPAFLVPPPLPPAPVDPAQAAACATAPPPGGF